MLAQKPAAIELVRSARPRTAADLDDAAAHRVRAEATGACTRCPRRRCSASRPTWRGIAALRSAVRRSARARLALEPLDPAVAHGAGRRVGRRRSSGGGSAPRPSELIAEPLLGGIHAGDIESLSIAVAVPAPRSTRKRGAGSVLRALPAHAARERRRRAVSLAARRHGRARRRRSSGGCRPDRSAAARPFATSRRSARGWRVSTDGGPDRGARRHPRAPGPRGGALLRRSTRAPRRCAPRCRYVSTASVALAWPRDAVRHPLAGSGFVVARAHNAVRITACTWVSSKWSGRAPAGHVLLRAFVGGAHDPGAVDLADDELIDIAVARPRRRPRDRRARRFCRASTAGGSAGAQHNVGQIARVAEIESPPRAARALFVAGSGFRSVGIPDCIADGRAAGAAAADDAIDRIEATVAEVAVRSWASSRRCPGRATDTRDDGSMHT